MADLRFSGFRQGVEEWVTGELKSGWVRCMSIARVTRVGQEKPNSRPEPDQDSQAPRPEVFSCFSLFKSSAFIYSVTGEARTVCDRGDSDRILPRNTVD